MADTTVHIGENSPEHVALDLFHLVRTAENPGDKANRKWILDTYAECLNAVQNPNHRVPLTRGH